MDWSEAAKAQARRSGSHPEGLLAHHVGLERIEVLLSLLEGSQRVTLPESDV